MRRRGPPPPQAVAARQLGDDRTRDRPDTGRRCGRAQGSSRATDSPKRSEGTLARAIESYCLILGDHGEVAELTQIPARDLPKARVLIGGFPCQDFSSSGPKVGFAGERGQLYQVLLECMREHKPEMVIGENVPHLATLHGGQDLASIVSDLEGEVGYAFEEAGARTGGPQGRKGGVIRGDRGSLTGENGEAARRGEAQTAQGRAPAEGPRPTGGSAIRYWWRGGAGGKGESDVSQGSRGHPGAAPGRV